MSEPRSPQPCDLRRYTRVKRWSFCPAYHDAPFPSRMIVDAALEVFMDRGHVPEDPNALRRAIGAKGWRSFKKAYPAAREAIDALLPEWQIELDAALRFVRRQWANGSKGGRPKKAATGTGALRNAASVIEDFR